MQHLEAHRKQPRVLRWRDQTVNDGHPRGDEFDAGFHAFMPIYAKSAKAALVFRAAGVAGPTRVFPNEHLIFIVNGRWGCAIGDESYELEANDLVFIPADAEYSMSNVGDEDGMHLSIYVLSREAWAADQHVSPPYDRPPVPSDRDSTS
jgi:mannose-6-phosphate isomerase-like protein (cupin superfamily)